MRGNDWEFFSRPRGDLGDRTTSLLSYRSGRSLLSTGSKPSGWRPERPEPPGPGERRCLSLWFLFLATHARLASLGGAGQVCLKEVRAASSQRGSRLTMRFGGKESSVKWGPLCCWQMRSLGPLFAWRVASLGWRAKPGSGKLQRVWGRVGFELTPPLPQSTFCS